MKKITIIFFVIVAGWYFWQKNNQTNQPFTVGILQIVEHPALDETREGITQKLNKLAKKNSRPIKILYESAQNNTSLASQIAQNYVGRNVNIIVTLGTTATQTAIRAVKDKNIPVIFASVSDPTSSKITDKNGYSKSATGVSNFVAPQQQIKYFSTLFPHVKKIGVLFNPGEDNAVLMKDFTHKAIKERGLLFESAAAHKISEVSSAAEKLASSCDAIFINNDNTALSAIESVARICAKNNILLLSSDLSSFKQGADAAIGPNQFTLGEQTADLIWRVLDVQKITHDMRFEKPKQIFIYAKV